MRPGSIENYTRDLGRPTGWEERHCGSLPIRDVVDPDIGPQMVSDWIPDAAERAAIAAGAPVRLSVCGVVHPPVAVGVGVVGNMSE